MYAEKKAMNWIGLDMAKKTGGRAKQKKSRIHELVEKDSQKDNDQHKGQDQQQDTSLAPRALLVITRLLEVDVRTARGIVRHLDVLLDDVELGALLVHHVRDVAEELVELADGLFDVADLRFAFDDELLLEIHLVLRCQA